MARRGIARVQFREGEVATYDVCKVRPGDAAADSTLDAAEEGARDL